MSGEDYKEFLAARILTDALPVNYRLLSRAVKVNVNEAKQMLFEFYTKQNAKNPKSVHATYVLTGKQQPFEDTKSNTSDDANGEAVIDGDNGETYMPTSSFMSAAPNSDSPIEPSEPKEKPIAVTAIEIVREEELEETKTQFLEITSIHIYSLEPGPLEDLDFLSVCNEEVRSGYANENPMERWRVYGSIYNPYIKRRMKKNAVIVPKAAPTAITKPSLAVTASKKEAVSAPAHQGSASDDKKSARSAPGPAAPSLKRSDSKSNVKIEKSAGDIFKSFAKAKPKAKAADKPTAAEDDVMQGMSEDDMNMDDDPQLEIDAEQEAAARKAREERKKKLQEMMDADVEMPDAPAQEETDTQDAPVDKQTPTKPAESEEAVKVTRGRRRGRRQVMKKKTAKDEDGYLVTKQEAVWESFSEDEPEPKKPKSAPKPTTAKGKKPAGKGQGSIASFFKKA